jgi:hypothetical protein
MTTRDLIAVAIVLLAGIIFLTFTQAADIPQPADPGAPVERGIR